MLSEADYSLVDGHKRNRLVYTTDPIEPPSRHAVTIVQEAEQVSRTEK